MRQGFGRRLTAGLVDLLAGLSLCWIIHWPLGYYFATRAVVAFRIGAPDTLWKGTIPWLMGIFGTYVYTIPLALWLILLPEAIWGFSIGKMLWRLRIKGSTGQVAPSINLWSRYLLKTCVFWGLTLSLIVGSWNLVVLSTVIGLLILLFDLHDRWSKTAVYQ
jgi:hypothetical protein